MNSNQEVQPSGAYLPVQVLDSQEVWVSGMTPKVNNSLVTRGQIGKEVLPESGAELARIAMRRVLDAVAEQQPQSKTFVPAMMTVFINCVDTFSDHSSIADGASAELIAKTGHSCARAAVGVSSLPGQAPLEITLQGRWVGV